jgi:peptidoglycan/xylan/chitin deacetylase (PgdA/CDA1 family)
MCVIPVLLYHKIADLPAGARFPEIVVSPAQFAAQLAMLRAMGRHAITMAQYVAHWRFGAALPHRPVVITFDDGYRSNYEIAFPILQRFGVSATIFLVTRLVGRTNVWDPDERQEPLLDWACIREMQRAGIDFQSHTSTHARLTAVPQSVARRELCESRLELEQRLGTAVDTIAYPWGAHDEHVLRLAAEAGYSGGVIVRRRVNFSSTPRLALRRIEVGRASCWRRLGWDLLRLRWRGA